MDLPADSKYLFLAAAGLKAPVPKPWQAYLNENSDMFYVNSETNAKMIDHPLDKVYKDKFLALKNEEQRLERIRKEAAEKKKKNI